MLTEEGFETGGCGVPVVASGVVRAPCVHLHHLFSTADTPNVTPKCDTGRKNSDSPGDEHELAARAVWGIPHLVDDVPGRF